MMKTTRTRCALAALLIFGVFASSAPATRAASAPRYPGKVFMTQPEALGLAFPKCKIERQTAYLTDRDKAEIGKLSGGTFETGIVYPYVATLDGKPVGTAYFETHRVRTLRETVMIVVTPKGTIDRIEVLSFGEPQEYIPVSKWYEQFLGQPLSDELQLQRKIRPVTGATLTARATTDAARRTLALHRYLSERSPARQTD